MEYTILNINNCILSTVAVSSFLAFLCVNTGPLKSLYIATYISLLWFLWAQQVNVDLCILWYTGISTLACCGSYGHNR